MAETKEAPEGADMIVSQVKRIVEDIAQQKPGLTMFSGETLSGHRTISIEEVIKDLTNVLNKHGVYKEFRLVTLVRCVRCVTEMLDGLGEEYRPSDIVEVAQELQAATHAMQNYFAFMGKTCTLKNRVHS